MCSPGSPGSPSLDPVYPSLHPNVSTECQGVSLSTRHLTWCQESCTQGSARNIIDILPFFLPLLIYLVYVSSIRSSRGTTGGEGGGRVSGSESAIWEVYKGMIVVKSWSEQVFVTWYSIFTVSPMIGLTNFPVWPTSGCTLLSASYESRIILFGSSYRSYS